MPTCDFFKRKSWYGPGHFYLCKDYDEYVANVFIHYPCKIMVCEEIVVAIG